MNAALEMPKEAAAALLASAEGYTPRANQLLDAARERLGSIQEVAGWIADSLPQPKAGPTRARRRRRRKKRPDGQVVTGTADQNGDGTPAEGDEAAADGPVVTVHQPPESPTAEPGAPRKRRRRPRKPQTAEASPETVTAPTDPERTEDAA